MTMDENVAKAVERLEFRLRGVWEPQADVHADWQTIRTHLLAREAEVERHVKMLADCFRRAGADPDGNEDWRIAPEALRAVTDLRRDYDEVLDWQARSERAEATLREIRDSTHKSALMLRAMADRCITAHLSENSRG